MTLVQNRKILGGLLIAASIVAIVVFSLNENASAAPSVIRTDYSWNPYVSCTAAVVRISDITNNQTATSTLPYGPYSPGITAPTGDAKRWLTQSSLDPSGWKAPGPACTIKNSSGQTVASFVEIDGLAVSDWSYEDCRSNYNTVNGGTIMQQSFCDSDGNLYDPALVPNGSTACASNTDPTCYSILHVEFDGDWMAAGMCGPSTSYCNNDTLVSSTVRNSASTLVDVQGFVYWDNEHTCVGVSSGCVDQWHSYNGWELHPLTAWRPHQSSNSPSAYFTHSPSSPDVNTTISFAGTAYGGTPPYTYSWNYGDGSTGSGSTVAHRYSSAGIYTVTLTVTDNAGNGITDTQQVSVSLASPPPNPPPSSNSGTSGANCLICVLPTGLATNLWLLIMSGLSVVISLFAVTTIRARGRLAQTKEQLRYSRKRDTLNNHSPWTRQHAPLISGTQLRFGWRDESIRLDD